jgi:hypothetical protein
MNRRIKSLLVWLLLFALPLQGMAAAVQASCTSHHALMQAGAMPAHASHLAGHVAHHHDSTHSANASGDKLQDTGSCSSCASCCVGAIAIASQFDIAPVAGPVSGVIAALPPLFAGFIPSRLERPPRVSFS